MNQMTGVVVVNKTSTVDHRKSTLDMIILINRLISLLEKSVHFLTSAHLEHSESIFKLSVFRLILTTEECHMGRRAEAADRTVKDTRRQTRKRY